MPPTPRNRHRRPQNRIHRLRIFISYSHEDLPLAKRLDKALRSLKLEPVWDNQIRPGMAFTDAIKSLIAQSHVFVPILTENSKARPWVHQETGYAIALGIPVLPVAVSGVYPGELLQQLQAILVRRNLRDIADKLKDVDFERILFPAPPPVCAVEVAYWPERRTELMAQYMRRVAELSGPAVVRQRGAFSTFSIPDKDPTDDIWRLRDGGHPRSELYRHLQRAERQAMEWHARQCDCFLIIDPTLVLREREPVATKVRLEELLLFLGSPHAGNVWVATTPLAQSGSLTIVGDWFVADSLVPSRAGYWQTIFHWHAPTALREARKFDQVFHELTSGLQTAEATRKKAIAEIQKAIRSIKPRRNRKASRRHERMGRSVGAKLRPPKPASTSGPRRR